MGSRDERVPSDDVVRDRQFGRSWTRITSKTTSKHADFVCQLTLGFTLHISSSQFKVHVIKVPILGLWTLA